MDSLDNFRERFEALEQQTKAMEAHTHTVERRLRWWRGIACSVVILSLLSLALPLGKAADAPGRGMAERMATMDKKLAAMDFDDAVNEVVISGANLRIVNGLGTTDTTNGLGNLIVGYNESRSGSIFCPVPAGGLCTDTRMGSHNVVVGRGLNFSSFGGLVVGDQNEISGEFSSVLGGLVNTASGRYSSVSGGGEQNTASGAFTSISGGRFNAASGAFASIGGGFLNSASGGASSVSGGENNTASGEFSSVSGGHNRTAPAPFNWAAGALFSDQ